MESTVMKKFIAAKDTRIVSDDGSMCMNFESGQERPVHPWLFSAAIRGGLVPTEPLEVVEEKEPKVRKSTEEETADQVLEAVKTQLGQPRTASVKKLVDCEFTAAEVQRAFEQAMFEVETSGDESTEHSESSSSDTE
jgi:hypothetical protein